MLEINKVYQGDCLEVMKDIDDKSIDMILCDFYLDISASMFIIVHKWGEYETNIYART